MWVQHRGPERYSKLFRALGDIYGAPEGELTRLYIPLGKEFKQSSKYSKNEAFLMNVLHDAGGRYETFQGGYYRGLVLDTQTNNHVSIQGVLAKIGRKEHMEAVKAATPSAIAAKLREMKYTTASDREGGGKGLQHQRFVEIDEVSQTAIDLKPVRRDEFHGKTSADIEVMLAEHRSMIHGDPDERVAYEAKLVGLISARKRLEAEEIEKDSKRTADQRRQIAEAKEKQQQRDAHAASLGGRVRTFAQLADGLAWTMLDKLSNAINDDPIRQNSALVDGSGMMLVVSRDPVDIASMSTNRSWSGSSCLCLEYDRKHARGGNAHFIPNMLKFGAIVVYGCRVGDTKINNPVNRMTLLPFINDKDPTDVIMLQTSRRYGEPFPGFMLELQRLLDYINAGNLGGSYSTPKKYQFYDRDVANSGVKQPPWSQDKSVESSLAKLGVKKYRIREDGLVDVDGDVLISIDHNNREDVQLPVRFGRVSGSFIVGSKHQYNPTWYHTKHQQWNITSKAAGLDISTNNITTLKGFPEYVGGDFDISGCAIESLVGCPQHIGGHFLGLKLRNLENLVGGPKFVGKNYEVSHSGIKETRGLDDCEIGGSLVLNNTKLTHITGKAKSVGGDVELSMTELRTTLGLPDRIEGGLYMRKIPYLLTLRGMPKYVGGNVSISMCYNIKSMAGLENTEIRGDLWFNNGNLTSIDCAPKLVHGDMQMHSHRLPRDTQKPASVKGLLLLGRKDDGSDFCQQGDSDDEDTKLKSLGIKLTEISRQDDGSRFIEEFAT